MIRSLLNHWPLSMALPVLLRARAMHYKKYNVGKGAFIASSAHVIGWPQVRVGNYSCLGEDVFININHREQGKIGLIIGDNCFIGKSNFFTTGRLIRLGDYCITAPDCKFLGAFHEYGNPFMPYVISPCPDQHSIEIGTNCFIGAGATIMHQVKIGFGSVIGAGAVVSKDIPPMSLVVGSSGEVKKRFSIKKNAWVKLEEYSTEDEAMLPSEEGYLSALKVKYPVIKLPFIACSRECGDL